MSNKGAKPEESGELMYVKCAYCGKWLDVKPGQMNWVSHGMCEDCLRKEVEGVTGQTGDTPAPDGPKDKKS